MVQTKKTVNLQNTCTYSVSSTTYSCPFLNGLCKWRMKFSLDWQCTIPFTQKSSIYQKTLGQVWPDHKSFQDDGAKLQMVSTFYIWIFWLESLDYPPKCSTYFQNFPIGHAKIVLPYTCTCWPKFPELLGWNTCNGEQPQCSPIRTLNVSKTKLSLLYSPLSELKEN